ncbi:isocitrate lyase/PEP mutase family protein [bacterium]|jgi:2,3-dimethylmalate lyase|nr:isocitrate lyase/PEP mutase family protein [bacterium]
MSRPTQTLRSLIAKPGIIQSLGIHDVFSALIAERSGYELLFIGGFGTSASLYGLPDLNFISMTEMADAVRRTTAAVTVPIIADGDTGHGDLHNVQHTVRSFERAGAAGMLLEDQVMPKRCGHFGEKQVIPKSEMILKIKAALAAKNDPDFTLIARTDARQITGLDDAIERMNAYCEAGADVAFIEAPESSEELRTIADKVPYPLFANMLTGGKTPIHSSEELETMGYKFAVLPIETLMVCARALEDLCVAFKQTGKVDSLAASAKSFDDLKSMLGVDKHLGIKDSL